MIKAEEQTPVITQTIGGHAITEFKKMEKPEKRYGDTEMIYEGMIVNDYTKRKQRCTWDKNGHVVNRNVPRYDIELTTKPQPL